MSTPPPAGDDLVEWRCFHCGDVFTDQKTAEDHFGFTTLHPPGCVDPLRSDEQAMRERASFYERAWREALAQRDALEAVRSTRESEIERLTIQRLAILAAAYKVAPKAVAYLCDTQIDKSGALLGEVREMAQALNKGTDDVG